VQLVAQQLPLVTRQDVLTLFDTAVAQGSPQRRKFSSFMYGCNHPLPVQQEEGGKQGTGGSSEAEVEFKQPDGVEVIEVTDLLKFRLSLQLLPVREFLPPFASLETGAAKL
jgi:hypothetical protein